MENLNLPPFLPGDKVVYLTGISMPKNSIHTVTKVFRNPCGCWGILIDTKSPSGTAGYYKGCQHCRKDFIIQQFFEPSWHPKSFRKVQEQPFRTVTFEKIMEETEKICVN